MRDCTSQAMTSRQCPGPDWGKSCSNRGRVPIQEGARACITCRQSTASDLLHRGPFCKRPRELMPRAHQNSRPFGKLLGPPRPALLILSFFLSRVFTLLFYTNIPPQETMQNTTTQHGSPRPQRRRNPVFPPMRHLDLPRP